MRDFRILFMVISLGVVTSSCKNEKIPEAAPSSLKITVQPVYNGQTLYLDSTYTTVEGYKVQFTDIKFYVENVRSGSNNFSDAGLFDYRERGTALLETQDEPSNFNSLDCNLGVSSLVNHSDPTAFENSSMLNLANANDMHWGWNTGYIFLKIEAKVDTIPDTNEIFNQNVVFHIGTDVNMQVLQFNAINWHGLDAGYIFPLKVDMATFLNNGVQTIDLKNENSSHSAAGQEVLSMKVITNFRDAISEL